MIVTSDYEAEEDDELTLHQGETLIVLEQPDADWWLGYKEGRLGYFPSSSVQVSKVTFLLSIIKYLKIVCGTINVTKLLCIQYFSRLSLL